MRRPFLRYAAIASISLLPGACGSFPDIDDVMGSGKAAPDESQVRVHQVLAMPPDYQLRPPADGSNVETGQTNPLALPNIKPGGTPPALNQPQQDPTEVANADPDKPGPQAITPTNNQNNDPDTYNGVSTKHPDGTPKSRAEINEELRKKHVEAKRKEDPNYGTIWNIGSLFDDIF